MQEPLVSIIIPAYQEEKRIAHTIESLSSYEEVYADWTDKSGSTVRIFLDSLRSLRDLIIINRFLIIERYD